MEYRLLGNSGLKVSQFSFGSWVTFGNQMDVEPVKNCLKYAFDHGVNFFDNAEVYANGKSESIMAKGFNQLGLQRNEYVLTTKFFWGIEDRINFKNTLNRKYLTQAMNNSLLRLNTDFVDVVYCHRYDPETPISEIVFTMDAFIRQGKALYWGTSEWPGDAISKAYNFAIENSLNPPIVEQPQYNLLEKNKVEKEFSELYSKMKLGLTTWSPLASGQLTGKYMTQIPDGSRRTMKSMTWLNDIMDQPQNISKTNQLKLISEQSGVSMTHLAIGWCALNPHVSTVILGASHLDQLKENLAVISKLNIIRDFKKQLDLI